MLHFKACECFFIIYTIFTSLHNVFPFSTLNQCDMLSNIMLEISHFGTVVHPTLVLGVQILVFYLKVRYYRAYRAFLLLVVFLYSFLIYLSNLFLNFILPYILRRLFSSICSFILSSTFI